MKKVIIAVGILLLGALIFHTKKQSDAKALTLTCSGAKLSDKSCWENLFKKTLRTNGVDGALDLLAYAYDTTKAVGDSTCHDLTHFIGREAYKIFASGKSFPVSAKTAYCNYGFYHGVIEAMVGAKKPLTDAKKFCDYVDSAISKEAPEALLQCYHGIGHGAANNHDPRTWGSEQAMIAPALAICDQVSQSREERWRCASGVFHGLGRFYREHLYNLVMRTGDPFWFCTTQLRDEYKETCYRELVQSLGLVTDGTPKAIVSAINTIGEDVYAKEAMRAWGVPNYAFCTGVPQRLRSPCIESIARQRIQAGKPGSEVESGIQFCQETVLSTDEKTACFDFVFYWNSRWNVPEKAMKLCDTVTSTFKSECYRMIHN
ncbi:hypothetical protein HY086_04050 [Candidatus Gottesmanbacteria bacterium]|nr:hypothetical protein [Candidatus Gottesmanbacteria bacterium]